MFRIGCLLLLCLSLSSCSTKLFYNYADWWLEWQIDDLVDLNDEQEEQATNLIDEFFAWHRENELKEYARLLEQYKTVIGDKDTVLFEQAYQQTFAVWQRSAQFIAPKLISLLSTLEQAQKQQLVKNIKLKQDEQHEKWLEDVEEPHYRSERLELQVESLEDRLGYLTESQKKKYINTMQQTEPTLTDRIEARKSWLIAFEKALLVPSINKDELQPLLIDINSQRSASHQQKSEFNRGLYKTWMLSLLNEMESEQRSRLIDEVEDYMSDIQYLTRQ